jgi:ORMDL family
MVLASDVHGQPIVGRQTSVSQMQTAGINKNTSWLSSTGAWAFYAGLIIFGWLVLSLFMDGGFAWTWIHLIHGIVTFYLLHWMKVGPHFKLTNGQITMCSSHASLCQYFVPSAGGPFDTIDSRQQVVPSAFLHDVSSTGTCASVLLLAWTYMPHAH